ncbi:hypothetical protein [Bradyrhizobium sp. USDA 10063]
MSHAGHRHERERNTQTDNHAGVHSNHPYRAFRNHALVDGNGNIVAQQKITNPQGGARDAAGHFRRIDGITAFVICSSKGAGFGNDDWGG